MIHLEGMGLLGSLAARRLDAAGYRFTWSDIGHPFSAWQACTGIAYPSGEQRDVAGLARWYRLADEIAEAARVPYLYAHKNPPHGGTYAVAADYGHVRRARPLAVALNVPAFVTHTHQRFAEQRAENAEPGDLRIICHATPERGDGYLWGWAARVRLSASWMDVREMPALYSRAHRFNLTYAYPIPGTGQWWAGSALQYQRTPKRVSAERMKRYLLEWADNAVRLLKVTITDMEMPVQGWRPRARADDPGGILATEEGALVLPPMATDGMRHGPLVVDELMQRLHSQGIAA